MAWHPIINVACPWAGGGGECGAHVAALWRKNCLKAAGLSVIGSGDGDSLHGGAGVDVLSNALPTPAAGSFANPDAWIGLEQPDGSQLVLQNKNGSVNVFLHAYSVAAGFTGGGISARPTATDEVCWGHPHAPASEAKFALNIDTYLNFIYGDEEDGLIPWFFWQAAASGGAPGFAAGCCGHVLLRDVATGEQDPSMQYDYLDGQWAPFDSLLRDGAWFDLGGGGEAYKTLYAGGIILRGVSSYLPEKSLANPTDSLRRTRRADWWHVDGGLTNAYWRGRSDAILSPWDIGAGADYNKLARDQNGEIYVAMAGTSGSRGLLIPGWPDVSTCPLPDLGGGVSVEDVVLIEELGGDATAPTLTVVSPAGSDIGPRQPFVIDVTDDAGLGLVVLTVELGSAHEVVWLRDAFAAGYSALSTCTPIAGGYRFAVNRAGGWPSSPTFHVEAIDLGGNLGA